MCGLCLTSGHTWCESCFLCITPQFMSMYCHLALLPQEPGGHCIQFERWGPRTQTGKWALCSDSRQYSWERHVLVVSQDNKRMKRTLEEEQRARKELERIIRRVLKNMNDPSWDETNLWNWHHFESWTRSLWANASERNEAGPSQMTFKVCSHFVKQLSETLLFGF